MPNRRPRGKSEFTTFTVPDEAIDNLQPISKTWLLEKYIGPDDSWIAMYINLAHPLSAAKKRRHVGMQLSKRIYDYQERVRAREEAEIRQAHAEGYSADKIAYLQNKKLDRVKGVIYRHKSVQNA